MSKITFRADEDLIKQLEGFDASKSEVMRQALREYLGEPTVEVERDPDSIDDLIAERVDAIIAERLDQVPATNTPQDVNVNITLDGDSSGASVSRGEKRKTLDPDPEDTPEEERKTCKQCGEILSPSAVYCQNCGEKASRRVFCECGDEVRSDWAFCPSCGRRTTAADVLDNP